MLNQDIPSATFLNALNSMVNARARAKAKAELQHVAQVVGDATRGHKCGWLPMIASDFLAAAEGQLTEFYAKEMAAAVAIQAVNAAVPDVTQATQGD